MSYPCKKVNEAIWNENKFWLRLTKLSKIVYHDKSYSFETDLGWFISFNEKKNIFETKCPFL